MMNNIKVQTVTNLFTQLGIPAFTKQLCKDYQQKAYDHLAQVNGNPIHRELSSIG
ncbi:MAG: hypothetical protein R2795_14330 [Saprospiraceae bacterium]